MRAKLINEGAWGHYPLDNDSASDWKWKFGDMIIAEIKNKINKGLKSDQYSDWSYLYYSIGMWEFFKERLKTQYTFFTDDEIEEMDKLTTKAAQKLLDADYGKVGGWKEPDVVNTYLKNYINKNSND